MDKIRMPLWRKRYNGIRVYLVALAVMTTLPLAFFSLLLVGELRDGEYEALQRRTTREAEAIGRLVERQLHDMTTTLQLLESATEIQSGDYASFHARAQAALANSSWHIIMIDETGQQILNTRAPFGAPLGPTSNMAAWDTARQSGNVLISNSFVGRTSGELVYNVMKRVDAGTGSLGLILTQNAADLRQVVGSRPLPAGWHYAVVDGVGQTILSSNGVTPGQAFPDDLLRRAREGDGASGAAELIGHAGVRDAAWEVVVWGPTAAATEPINTTLRNLTLLGLLFFMLSLGTALIVGRRLQAGIKLIARRAEAVGRGELVSPVTSGVRELDQVSIALSEASFDRYQAEERVQVVLREMAHRTKNIVLIAQVLIRQSARYSDDIDAFVASVSGRLSAFAQSLELLTTHQGDDPMFREVVEAQLRSFVDQPRRLTITGEDFRLTSDAVKEVGMLLHELATNATKYGALSVPEGRIEIRWEETHNGSEEILRLTWREVNGPPPNPPSEHGFGSRLIQTTVGGLQGTARCEYAREGVVWAVQVPLSRLRTSTPRLDAVGNPVGGDFGPGSTDVDTPVINGDAAVVAPVKPAM